MSWLLTKWNINTAMRKSIRLQRTESQVKFKIKLDYEKG